MRIRYERGEEVDSEEEKESEEKSQNQLEREFSENSLIKIGRQEKFFKPYRKETEKLQERNEELKREIANLRKIFGKNKKDAKTYMREIVNKENQEKIISRIKNVISCLYSETPTKKRTKATQLREDSER
jgi:predicted RNase H-like nuclease (RuvC/YqgF family)